MSTVQVELILCGEHRKSFPDLSTIDKNIVSIDASNNDITEIPKDIYLLRTLKSLNLENNNITELHSGILKLTNLRVLNLKGNPIKRLPDFIKEKFEGTILMDSGVFTGYPHLEVDNSIIEEYKYANFFKDLREEVHSIFTTGTKFIETTTVPDLENNLTFTRHNDRKGKSIKTCILFVDIRNSVKMNDEHRTLTLSRIYSAFIYGVLKISKEFGGHVRNIIGDRVMVVFDELNCCYNAVTVGAMIMDFSKNNLAKNIPDGEFDCGIGIHYGVMNVIKVGLTVNNSENGEYQNLVWLGEPANLASRLTDHAGKDDHGTMIPHIIISEAVHKEISEYKYYKQFKQVNRSFFKDIDFSIYGCNLYIK